MLRIRLAGDWLSAMMMVCLPLYHFSMHWVTQNTHVLSQTNCLCSCTNIHPVSMLLTINYMYDCERLHHAVLSFFLLCRHDSASLSIWNNGKRTGNYCWYHVCAFFTPLSQPFPLLSLQQNSITLILPYNHFSSLRLDSFPGLTEKSLITLWPWLSPPSHFLSYIHCIIPPEQTGLSRFSLFHNTQAPVQMCEPQISRSHLHLWRVSLPPQWQCQCHTNMWTDFILSDQQKKIFLPSFIIYRLLVLISYNFIPQILALIVI